MDFPAPSLKQSTGAQDQASKMSKWKRKLSTMWGLPQDFGGAYMLGCGHTGKEKNHPLVFAAPPLYGALYPQGGKSALIQDKRWLILQAKPESIPDGLCGRQARLQENFPWKFPVEISGSFLGISKRWKFHEKISGNFFGNFRKFLMPILLDMEISQPSQVGVDGELFGWLIDRRPSVNCLTGPFLTDKCSS